MSVPLPPIVMWSPETVGKNEGWKVYMLATVAAFLVCRASFQRLKLACREAVTETAME